MGEHFAELMIVCSSLVWVSSLVFFRKAGDVVAPVALNFFKNVFSLPFAALTAVLVGGPLVGGGWWAAGVMAVSALLGMVLGDSLALSSLNRVGAGWSTVVNAAYSPLMVLVTSWVFDVSLNLMTGLGVGLVTVAVWMSREPREVLQDGHQLQDHQKRNTLLFGLGIGLFAQLLMVVGLAIMKYPLWGHPPVMETESAYGITAWRLLFGSLLMATWLLVRSDRKALIQSLKPSRTWRLMVPGTLMGTYLSLILWFTGIQSIGEALVKASVLGQSGLIFLPFMGWYWLNEQLSLRKMIASGVALVGSVVVVAA